MRWPQSLIGSACTCRCDGGTWFEGRCCERAIACLAARLWGEELSHSVSLTAAERANPGAGVVAVTSLYQSSTEKAMTCVGILPQLHAVARPLRLAGMAPAGSKKACASNVACSTGVSLALVPHRGLLHIDVSADGSGIVVTHDRTLERIDIAGTAWDMVYDSDGYAALESKEGLPPS